jgi:hypothetical protein
LHHYILCTCIHVLHIWVSNFVFINSGLYLYYVPRISSVFECDGRKYVSVSMSTEAVEVEPSWCTKALVFDTVEYAPTSPHIRILSCLLVKREIWVEIELIEWIDFAWTAWNLTFPSNSADVFMFVFQPYAGFSYSHTQSSTEWHKRRATQASVIRIRFFSGTMQWRNNNNNNNNNNINNNNVHLLKYIHERLSPYSGDLFKELKLSLVICYGCQVSQFWGIPSVHFGLPLS